MSALLNLVRTDLRDFSLYTPADSDVGAVRLHANELPWRPKDDGGDRGLNRYPEPRPAQLRRRLAECYGVTDAEILLTRGSDDGIDLLVRTFCRAGHDRVLVVEPCFAMYAACARLQGCGVDEIELHGSDDFGLEPDALLEALMPTTKLVFLCSPNNPTGSVIADTTIETLCHALASRSLVVVDEAYGEFSSSGSAVALLASHPNLVVVRTMSKAYGLAGVRLGSVLASAEIIAVLNRLMTPYPLPSVCVDIALAATEPEQLDALRAHWRTIVAERRTLADALGRLSEVTRIWPSDGNFVLARFEDATRVARRVRESGFLVRGLRQPLADCLRITVGAPNENRRLVGILETLHS